MDKNGGRLEDNVKRAKKAGGLDAFWGAVFLDVMKEEKRAAKML
jgi:hypothetical protein